MRSLFLIAALLLAGPALAQDPIAPPPPAPPSLPTPTNTLKPPPTPHLAPPLPIITPAANLPGVGRINPATGKVYTTEELRAVSANMRKYAESPVVKGNNYIMTRTEHLYVRFSIFGELGDAMLIDQSPAVLLYGEGYFNSNAYMDAIQQITDFNGRHMSLFAHAAAGAENNFDFSKPVDDKLLEQAQKNLDLYKPYEKRMETILTDCTPLFKQKLPIIAQLVTLDKAIKRANLLNESTDALHDQHRQLEDQLKPIDAAIAAKVAPIKDLAARDLFGPNAVKGPDLPPEEPKKDSKPSGVQFLTKGPSGWRPGGSSLVIGAPTIAEVTFDNDPGDTVPPLVLTIGGQRLELPLKPVAAGSKTFRSGEFLPWPGASDDGGLPLPVPIR